MKSAKIPKRASSNAHFSKPLFLKNKEGSFFSNTEEAEKPFFSPNPQPAATKLSTISSGSLSNSVIQRYSPVEGKSYNKLSDDGKMAVKDQSTNAWATPAKINKANRLLEKLPSKGRIKEESSDSIMVAPPGRPASQKRKLSKLQMIDSISKVKLNLEDDCGGGCSQMLGSDIFDYQSFVGIYNESNQMKKTSPSSYQGDDNSPGGKVSTTEQMSGEIYSRIFQLEMKKQLSRIEALKEWSKLSAVKKTELSKKYGINEYAAPKAGQGITIGSERDIPGGGSGGYNFHFAFALMNSGHDYLTAESFDKSPIIKFDIYGPATKKQSFAEEWGKATTTDDNNNVESVLGNKTTTMVVEHPERTQRFGTFISTTLGHTSFGNGGFHGSLGGGLKIPFDTNRQLNMLLAINGHILLDKDVSSRRAFLLGIRAGLLGKQKFAGGGFVEGGLFSEFGVGHFTDNISDNESSADKPAGYPGLYYSGGASAKYLFTVKDHWKLFIGGEVSYNRNIPLMSKEMGQIKPIDWYNIGVKAGVEWH